MKKFFYSFIVMLLFVGYSGTAFAGFTFNPETPQVAGVSIDYMCSIGTRIALYDSAGNRVAGSFLPCLTDAFNTYNTPSNLDGRYYFRECLTFSGETCDYLLDSDMRNANGYASGRYYDFTAPVIPPVVSTGGGIFFNKDDTTARDNLMASVATATGATFGTLGPVVAGVVAIILAFIFMVWIVNTIYGTDTEKKKNKR